jgi:hypothetical protein
MSDSDKKNPEKTGALGAILNLIKGKFPAHTESENDNAKAALEDSPLSGGIGFDSLNMGYERQDSDEAIPDRDALKERKLPQMRAARYPIFQEMAQDASLSEGLDMHLSLALSQDRRSNRSFEIVATAPEHEKLVAETNARLVPKINKGLVAWVKPACIFGINFVRPYCKPGVGIEHFQCDYWTLPSFVRKYEKGGLIAGYTSQHMRKEDGGDVYLAPPWSLLEIKIPFYQASIDVAPNMVDGKLYSLFDDVYHRTPLETQDYGTSLLEHCFEAYSDFKEAIDSLRASRRNASRIDRFITTQLESLDPVAAAEYMNLISSQMKSDMEHTEAKHRKGGTRPLINNTVIPVGGEKGGTTVDTQSTDPNIQHIEDIMLHLRRMVSALGLDVSLLGWASDMSGGIGDGGFFATSIQAARRAMWIRQASESFISDALDLDFWYRHKKAIPEGIEKPWRIVFHAQNTAIEEKEDIAREKKANFASIVATLVDTISLGSTNASPTLKKVLLSDVLDIDKDTLDIILEELNAKPAKGEGEGDLMSAFNNLTETEQAQMLLSRLMEQAE